jgi:hypothetical protein
MGNIRAFVAKLNVKFKNPNFSLNVEISWEWAIFVHSWLNSTQNKKCELLFELRN